MNFIRRYHHWQNVRDLGRADRAVALAFAALIYGFHVAPEIATHIVRPHPWTVAPALAILASYVWLRDRIREKSRRLFLFASGLYYSLLLAYISFLANSVAVSDPWIPLAMILWGGSVYLWFARGAMRFYLAMHLFVMTPVFINAARRSPGQAWLVIAGFLGTAALLVIAARRPKALAVVRPTAIGFFAAASILFPTVYARYQGLYPELADKIVARNGVRAAYRYDSEEYTRIGSSFMFAAEAADGVLLGPHDPNTAFQWIRAAHGHKRVSTAERLVIDNRAGDMAAYDPLDADTLFVGTWGRMLKLKIRPLRIEQETRLDAGLFNMVRANEKTRRLFASQDRGQFIARFNMDNPDDRATSPVVSRKWIFDVALDNERERWYAGALALDGWHIIEGDQRDMRILREATIPDAYGFFMEIDPAKRRLFLASFLTGEIFVVNLDSLRAESRHFVCKSVRNLTFDAKRRLLFASDYFGGRLIVIDPDSMKIIDRIEVGPIARYAQMNPSGDRIVLRTAAGVFSIDIDKALIRSPASKSTPGSQVMTDQ